MQESKTKLLTLFNPFLYKCGVAFFFKYKFLVKKLKKIKNKKIAFLIKKKIQPNRISFRRRIWRKKKKILLIKQKQNLRGKKINNKKMAKKTYVKKKYGKQRIKR